MQDKRKVDEAFRQAALLPHRAAHGFSVFALFVIIFDNELYLYLDIDKVIKKDTFINI